MPDVIIRGMDMGNTMLICPFTADDGYGGCYCVAGADCTGPYDERKYDCPVTVLPTGHGRLIDADALIASFRESVHECKKISEDGYTDALQEVNERAILATFIEAILRTKAQPTIIEAEGGSDGKA